jgi:predicted enzyme related to lactoylglutathione lyase
MSNTTTPNPVTWFEVHSADPDRAKTFYGSVFGWTFDDSMPGYSMIRLGDGAPIGGGIVHTGGSYPNDATFMVQVPDVAAALAGVTAHGGSVVTEPQATPFGLTFGYATNPDGCVFGVWCPPAG